MTLPSAKFVKKVKYDPATGVFSRVKVGRDGVAYTFVYEAKEANNGYARVIAFGQRYYAHRLAWYYVHGVMPDGEVDHINGDRSDNRIANLRPATRALNAANAQRPQRSFLRGVSQRKSKFWAQIKINSKQHYLGSFDTEMEAHEAFCRASIAARGAYARLD